MIMSPDSELERNMAELLPGKLPSPDMSDEVFKQEMSSYVETMKAKDNVHKIMKELKKVAPAMCATLVVEEGDICVGQGLHCLTNFKPQLQLWVSRTWKVSRTHCNSQDGNRFH